MKVVTLDNRRFAVACRMLAEVVAGEKFVPELVVGIRTGGEYVAREILGEFTDAQLAVVELQRPSTHHKSLVAGLLPMLPLRILDFMRIAESRLLALRPRRRVGRVEIPAEITGLKAKRILVVDDAIDSGVTMEAIVGSLREACPAAQVRSAVITVTTSRPLISPDYALYRNKTLIRFPWSMDMKA